MSQENEKMKKLKEPKNHKKGKRARKKQQKQLEYATERKTLIGMGNGLMTLNVAITHQDSMGEKEMRHEIVKGITKNKIRIAAIQENRITRVENYMMRN